MAGDARFLGLEWLVLGRRAHGETLTRGSLLDSWRVRVDGHLRWADGLRLDGDIASLVERRASLDGARALATLLYVADDAEQRIDLARECLPVDLRCGATLVNGMLLARFLADEPLALRQAVSMFLQGFRSGLAGGAVALPRVWAC